MQHPNSRPEELSVLADPDVLAEIEKIVRRLYVAFIAAQLK
jgi:hypothetical protein